MILWRRLDERHAVRTRRDSFGKLIRQARDSGAAFRIDFLPVIGGPVIVGVQARKEEDGGNPLQQE